MIYTLVLAVSLHRFATLQTFSVHIQVCAVDTSVDGQVIAIPRSSTKAAEAEIRTEETITIS